MPTFVTRIVNYWLFARRGHFIENRKLKLLLHFGKVTIYDLRSPEAYTQSHLRQAVNMDPLLIKNAIIHHKPHDIIVIHSERERTFTPIATWARRERNIKVYIVRNVESSRAVLPFEHSAPQKEH